jgi:hypothetical protein
MSVKTVYLTGPATPDLIFGYDSAATQYFAYDVVTRGLGEPPHVVAHRGDLVSAASNQDLVSVTVTKWAITEYAGEPPGPPSNWATFQVSVIDYLNGAFYVTPLYDVPGPSAGDL